MDNRKYNEKDVTASLDGIAEAIKSGGLAPSVIADPYSDEATYSVGDYVTFNAKSYRCITAIDTPEEFDSEKWDEIKVLDELASAVELPPVTSTDNGKILKVISGDWAKGDMPDTGTMFVITYNGTSIDKTSEEIYDAIVSGKNLYFLDTNGHDRRYIPLSGFYNLITSPQRRVTSVDFMYTETYQDNNNNTVEKNIYVHLNKNLQPTIIDNEHIIST